MVLTREKALTNLKAARWVRDPDCVAIFKAVGGLSDRTQAVGGAVRDSLLGRYSMRSDLDLATELTPDQVIEAAKGAGIGYYPTGIKHGTVTLRKGQVTVEVTTLRQDVETDGRHARVVFGKDWVADARRRDFSVNAMYSTMQGGLYDPLDALGDLVEGRVQFIGDAAKRLEEDYLRVYRYFRFSAGYGQGQFDPEGLAACRAVKDQLSHLSPERIGAEMMKLLALPKAAKALKKMSEIGLLPLSARCLSGQYGYEELSGVPVAVARLAIMLCDMDADELQRRWRLSNAVVSEARDLCTAVDMIAEGKYYELAYRFQRIGVVAIGIAAGMKGWTKPEYIKRIEGFHSIEVPRFPVTGTDLIDAGFERGPTLGKALKRLEQDWIKSGFELDRDRLMHRLSVYMSMPF